MNVYLSRHHSDGQFAIDDGQGTALSLLLVVRGKLQSCDQVLVPRADAPVPSRCVPTSGTEA